MNPSINRFSLDLHSTQSQISIPVLLGDTGREFHINLSDGGSQYLIEDGCLAKLSIKRPTGTHLEEFCTIMGNTTIVYPFNQNKNTAAVEGIHECDVTLYDVDGLSLGSSRFTMVVSERAVNSDDIVITDEDQTAIDAIIGAEASRKVAEAGRVKAEAERAANEEERTDNMNNLGEQLAILSEELDRLQNATSGSKDSAGGAVFAYHMEVGKTYVFTNTSASGEMNVFSRASQSSGNQEQIASALMRNRPVEFTPTLEADYIYIYGNKAYSFTIYETGTTIADLLSKDLEIESRIFPMQFADILIEQGGIDTAGLLLDHNARIRTKDFIRGTRRFDCPTGVVVFRVYYFNEETLAFDSYVTPNASSYTIGKDGCVAKVVFTKSNSNNPITPHDLKTSLVIEKMGEDVDKMKGQLPPLVKFDIDHNMRDVSALMEKVDYSTSEKRKTILEQVYSLFDALVSAYPKFVTKSDVAETLGLSYPTYANGVSGSNTYADTPAYKTYMYKFSYTNAYLGNSNYNKKKKLLITSGVHGNEIAAPFNTYLFAKQLCDGFTEDANFFKIRSAFDIYIIPCVNGYGMYHATRGNANKVNINRNFPVKRWKVGGADTMDSANGCNYTGASAGSEFETQLITGITASIVPDMAIDHHNYGGEQNWQFYTDVNEQRFLRLAYQSLADCSFAFKKNYPQYFGTDFAMVVNKSGTAPGVLLSTDSGTLSRWWYEYGIPFDATIEISHSINFKNGVYTSAEEQYLNADVFSVGEYTLRSQLWRYCQWLMENTN